MSEGAGLWATPAPFSDVTTRLVQSVVSATAGVLLLFSPLAVAYQASMMTDAPKVIESQFVPGRDQAGQGPGRAGSVFDQ